MTSSFGMGSHQATLEEDVTLLNGQTSSSLTGRTSGLPQGQLDKPVVRNDPGLKLWVLAAKGYTDIEINPSAAKKEWEEAREIASSLGEKQWVDSQICKSIC